MVPPLFLSRKTLQSRFIQAAKKGNVKEVAQLLGHPLLDPNQPDQRSHAAALYLAAQRGALPVVACLLRCSRINVNQEIEEPEMGEEGAVALFTDDYVTPSRNYVTPLHIACARGFVEVVQLLLRRDDVKPNYVSRGLTPLHVAIKNGQMPILKLLLANPRIDVNKGVGSSGKTALHYACEEGHVVAVYLLLGHPEIQPEKKTTWGISPLSLAYFLGHFDIVSLLFDALHARGLECEVGLEGHEKGGKGEMGRGGLPRIVEEPDMAEFLLI